MSVHVLQWWFISSYSHVSIFQGPLVLPNFGHFATPQYKKWPKFDPASTKNGQNLTPYTKNAKIWSEMAKILSKMAKI